MKAYVIGTSINEGVSRTTGKPYSIAKLFAALPLAGEGARGMMGSEYQVEASVLRKLDTIALPAYCELEMQDVMRYGKRQHDGQAGFGSFDHENTHTRKRPPGPTLKLSLP